MSTIELRCVWWHGNVVAINDITMMIGPGVTGCWPERRRQVHAAALIPVPEPSRGG
jgi:hypothetical protein